MDYQKQAKDFCEKNNVKIESKFLRHDKYFDSDTAPRDIYEITITTPRGKMQFEFGQTFSFMKSRFVQISLEDLQGRLKQCGPHKYVLVGVPPTEYDVLACLEKFGPMTFQDFCADFGYNSEDWLERKKAHAIWEKWIKEAIEVQVLFEDCIKELQEIE